MRLILPVLIAVLLIASPAQAEWTLDSAALAQLSRGAVHAEVHPDGDGVSGVVRGAVEIEASPDTSSGAPSPTARAPAAWRRASSPAASPPAIRRGAGTFAR
jgi:hypothetical protein